MKYIDSFVMQDANILLNDAPDAPWPVYSSGTLYASLVTVSYNHRLYQSRVGANQNNQPDLSPTQWLDIGPTNKWAMFDDSTETQTVGAGTSLNVQFNMGRVCNAVALLNVSAQKVRVQMFAMVPDIGYTNVYDSGSVDMTDNEDITDMYAWLFNPIKRKKNIVFLNLPSYQLGSIQVLLENYESSTAVGLISAGFLTSLGTADYGTSTGLVDYSTIKEDDFGNRTVTKRGYAKKMTVPVTVKAAERNAVTRRLEEIRQRNLVWIASKDIESTIMYGPYKSFDHIISNWGLSQMQLEIQALK